MDFTISFTSETEFNSAVRFLTLDAVEYVVNYDDLTIHTDRTEVLQILRATSLKFEVEGNGLNHPDDDERDSFRSDAEADADALGSIGWAEDEFYEHPGMDD